MKTNVKHGSLYIDEIRDVIFELKEKYGACALKLGTEAEGNSFEDIEYMKNMIGDLLPIVVKVGGPEAKNDIRKLSEIGVSGIIGPMIESPYALKIFVRTLKTYYKDLSTITKIINIETKQGFENLGEIITSPEFDIIDQITVGRSDLSASLGVNVDDEKVYFIVKEIVKAAHKNGKITSVGGQITPKNSLKVKEITKTDKINIRTVVIDLKKCENISDAIKKSLELEILILKNNITLFPEYADYYTNRIEVIKGRLNC